MYAITNRVLLSVVALRKHYTVAEHKSQLCRGNEIPHTTQTVHNNFLSMSWIF